MKQNRPLVSIIIPNKNYSRYLDESIQSALNQTYDNVEVIINDNCSNDDSLDIMLKYLERGLIINKNPIDIAGYSFYTLPQLARGEYILLLCSDDILEPTFIEHAVNIMEKHKNVGLVHCDRKFIDDDGKTMTYEPFFNCSFMAPGLSVLPILLLTEIGSMSAQGLMRRSIFEKVNGHETDIGYSSTDRAMWFKMLMISDYAYIRENLVKVRVHKNQGSTVFLNTLFGPVSLYMLIQDLLEWAKIRGYDKVLEREEIALKALARRFLSPMISSLKSNNIDIARKYLLFIELLDNEMTDDETYKKCKKICECGCMSINGENNIPIDTSYIPHARNYEPPDGFTLL